MKYIAILLAIAFIGTAAISWTTRVTHLDAPIITISIKETGPRLQVSGRGFAGAKAIIYANDVYAGEAEILSDGSFTNSVQLKEEGTTTLTVKQTYKNLSSELSAPHIVVVDATPPDATSVKITTVFPEFTKDASLTIEGIGEAGTSIVINGISLSVDNDGKFAGKVTLEEGSNILKSAVSDSFGNSSPLDTYTVEVDSVPPRIITGFFGCPVSSNAIGSGSKTLKTDVGLGKTEEFVCLSTGQWEDWRDPAPIPITGDASENIGLITVDGKRIQPDEKNTIYQRVSLPVPKGLNKYKVVAEDKYGNQSTAYLTMTVESVSRSEDDEVLDRLDDIDSRLNDIE